LNLVVDSIRYLALNDLYNSGAMYRHQANPTKTSKVPYLILVLFVGVLLLSAWFSTGHRRIFQDLTSKQEQEKLENEISELKICIAELTSVEHVHKLAKQMKMVQSSKLSIVPHTEENSYSFVKKN
tara:strand:+ start:1500 stop:1877 length:378 start_codon:yes stop_codon:yes gene_type:complete